MEQYALAQQIVTGHLCIMLRVVCNRWSARRCLLVTELKHQLHGCPEMFAEVFAGDVFPGHERCLAKSCGCSRSAAPMRASMPILSLCCCIKLPPCLHAMGSHCCC